MRRERFGALLHLASVKECGQHTSMERKKRRSAATESSSTSSSAIMHSVMADAR
jgi:hypothetical protein